MIIIKYYYWKQNH